ncbi:DUF6571 family protein [Streptomyces sp. STR69]|uniref:DUF6571 family protein n=1 Tax=Streptomyces sp. STR69 TaxID=1796942 RepID=UPI0021C84F27|nr:DUF6571 family protein [Streptomyces sp. STR69]
MPLKYTDLLDVDLGKLGAAVDDWKRAVDALKTLDEDARSGLKAKSDSARWAGVNADVTRGFVDRTAKEFTDLHTEANSIYQVLDDAHGELLALQRGLKALVEEARAKNYTITDNGDTTVTVHECVVRSQAPTAKAGDKAGQPWQSIADQISAKVGRADDVDQSVKAALVRSHGNDLHDAGHADYGSLNEAQAARAVELAKKGEHMSNAELKEFDRLMKYNGTEKGGEFATDFYKTLGPEKTLEFYGSMALDGTAGDNKVRLALTKDLQQSMGLALANATDPDHKYHVPASWGDQLRKLGGQRLQLENARLNQPYGYQVLGGLLRYGNYDAAFINPIAGHIVQLHHQNPNLFALNRPLTGGFDADFGYNPSGKVGTGYDPLTSVLEALGHSPEASKAFFADDSPKVYNADGGEHKGAKLGYTYFDELTDKNFQWPMDGWGVPAKAYGVDALGHALESATLGHAYDDPTPTLVRDEDSAKIMKQVVHTYGNDPKLVKQQEILSDSLGRMGAGYIDDLNWGLDENRSDSLFVPTGDACGHAKFGLADTRSFLSTIGQHPDAYADVSAAGKVYTTSVLEAQVADDGSINHGHAREAVRTGSQIQGMLDQSRADQVQAEGVAKDKEYNDALEKRNGWVEFGTGATVAAGVAFLPEVAAVGVVATAVPILMDTGQGALEQQIGNVIGDWTESDQKHSGDDIQKQSAEIFRAGEKTSAAPMQHFIARHGVDRGGDFGQDLKDAWINGYGQGTDRENQQGFLPQTED